jgi:23S rRNA (pseudouridine1915-N3)-methyltransferase
MKSVSLISVGKNKDKRFLDLEADYLKRITSFSFELHEVKASEDNLEIEAKNVLKKIESIQRNGQSHVVLLTEKGKKLDSPKFSQWLFSKLEVGSLILVIGGAAGHGQELYDQFPNEISLSDLTFPHKLARLALIEQIYRAQTINQAHPYHK